MKIGIFYDNLAGKGGGERVVITLANALKADIIVAGYDPEINNWLPIKTQVYDLGNLTLKFNKSIGRVFESPLRFLLTKKKLNYDVNIFFGTASIFTAKNYTKNKNIWYCFSPNRLLYDLKQDRRLRASIIEKALLTIHEKLFYQYDQQAVTSCFGKIIAQTETVKKRIHKYYKKESSVIYSPLITQNFSFRKFGDFFLTVARLFPEKRVDLIINAFNQMPTKKLVIVGDGPEKVHLQNIAAKNRNIRILDTVSESDLVDLYADCLATLYMPQDEDFGLVPLEGMASGKACIAANEGGCREVVTHYKTGYLIKPDVTEIVNAVCNHTLKKAQKMKKACQKRAKEFDIHSIIKDWKNLLQNLTI